MPEMFSHSNVKAVDMTLLDYFAIHAPEPDKNDVSYHMGQDRLRNPHNDTYKPRRRSESEIICHLRYEYAREMMEAR